MDEKELDGHVGHLSPAAMARLLKRHGIIMSEDTIQRLVDQQVIKAYRTPGNHRRIDPKEVYRYLAMIQGITL